MSSAPPLELLAPLRAALLARPAITTRLGLFEGLPSIHTRRPAPAGAGYPMILVGPIVARGDEDGIIRFAPVASLDIAIYGEQDHHYRDVEKTGDLVYAMFHRQGRAISVDHYSVTSIVCSGPAPAPADDDTLVGRRVSLTVRLYSR